MNDRRAPDTTLVIVVGILCCAGAVMVFSASSVDAYNRFHDTTYFLKRELLWLALGAAAFYLGQRIDYGKLRTLAPYLLFVSIALLVAVLMPHVGVMEGGARRWFSFRGISFEPSELAKLALVIYLACILSAREKGARSFTSIGFRALLLVGVCFALVLRQPDFGTASLFVATAFVLLFVGGARLGQLLTAAAIALPAMFAFLYSSAYRRERFTAFLHPWHDPQGTGYHIIQSLYALGSGGLFGLGLGESRQKFGYLPEQYTDFIYAIVGEELGFIGAAALLLLFGVFVFRGIRIAMKSDDRFGFFLAVGISASIAVQAFINIGVVTSSFPVTGVPLPFISYGGTSLVISLFGAGLLAGVSRGRSRAAYAAEASGETPDDAYRSRRRRHGRPFVPRAVTSQSALRRAR